MSIFDELENGIKSQMPKKRKRGRPKTKAIEPLEEEYLPQAVKEEKQRLEYLWKNANCWEDR